MVPNPLQKGDRVALIAPSSPISSMKAIHQSMSVFKKHGLIPVLGENVTHLRGKGWSSGTIRDRLDEIIWAFESEDIDAIVCAEGGFSAMELLPYLPCELIGETGKLFMGMSDVTAINNAILHVCDLKNFSGPNARIRQDKNGDENNLSHALSLLFLDDEWGTKPWKNLNTIPQIVCEGVVSGRAIGGNLTLFTALVGTPYMPDVDNAILFFEDVYAGGYEVAMNLNHLELAGIFDRCGGVVFGEFEKRPDRADADYVIEDVIHKKFSNRMPCIYGLNFSHGSTVATIPLGTNTTLDADNGRVVFGNPFDD